MSVDPAETRVAHRSCAIAALTCEALARFAPDLNFEISTLPER